jgi:hypothetical protein
VVVPARLAATEPEQVIRQGISLQLLHGDDPQSGFRCNAPQCLGIEQKEMLTPIREFLKCGTFVEREERVIGAWYFDYEAPVFVQVRREGLEDRSRIRHVFKDMKCRDQLIVATGILQARIDSHSFAPVLPNPPLGFNGRDVSSEPLSETHKAPPPAAEVQDPTVDKLLAQHLESSEIILLAFA